VAAVAEGNALQQNDPALLEWAGRISLDQIPGLLLFLTARWLAETATRVDDENRESNAAENLVTAGDVARRLNLPESWVRNEERLGRLPSVRLGKYIRFRLSEVERTLAQKQRRSP
jgi:hypothetical protein